MSIFNDKIEINGKEYKRINMKTGIKLQGDFLKCFIKSGADFKDMDKKADEEIISEVIKIIAYNTDFVLDIIKAFYGDPETLEVGDEYEILFDLKDHVDVKKIISQITSKMGLMGKVIPQK